GIGKLFFPAQAVHYHINLAVALLDNDFGAARAFNDDVFKHLGLGSGIAVLIADKAQRVGADFSRFLIGGGAWVALGIACRAFGQPDNCINLTCYPVDDDRRLATLPECVQLISCPLLV